MTGSMIGATFTFFEGDTREMPLRFRKRNFKGFTDLSGATNVLLHVERLTTGDRVALTPIVVDLAQPNADPANGLLVPVVGPSDVTAIVASYDFALTADLNLETITLVRGRIEILDRPGFP